MAVANTVAYYDAATIKAIISFIIEDLRNHFRVNMITFISKL